MTALLLTPAELSAAQAAAAEMGEAFGVARRSYKDTKKDAADLLHIGPTIIGRFERGVDHNVKLGNAVRLLRLYGLKLTVTRI